MGNLVVLGFEDEASAKAFTDKIGALDAEDVVDIDDLVTVVVDADGKRHIHHGASLARGGAVVGGILGGVVGLLFVSPVAGAAIGAAGGAAIGKLAGDYGISEDFIKSTSDMLEPGTVALFVLAKKAALPDRLEAEIKGTHARVISTNLDEATEARLRAALSE
jgi:uncharacterized membrane protein